MIKCLPFRKALTILTYTITILSLNLSAKADEHLIISTTEGGQLKDKILDSDFEDMISLTIQGPINAQDIQYITSNSGIIASVKNLDLSDAELIPDGEIYHVETEGGSGMGTSYRYEYRLCDTNYSSSNWDGISSTKTQICGNNFAGAFIKTGFEKIILPKNNSSIGERAFENCANLKEVVLSGKEKYIGQRAFFRCTALEKINMPESVDSISDDAFHDTKSLKQIDLSNVGIFGGDTGLRYYYSFPYDSQSHGIFRNSGITEIKLSDKCSTIAKNCFYGCSEVITIDIPGSIKKIPDQAFSRITSLSTLTLHEGIEEIGRSNFGSSQLTTVALPSTLTTLGSSVFGGSKKLTDVVLPPSLLRIGEDAFSDTPFLTNNLQEENNVKYLGKIAYKVSTKVTPELIIREGTTTICDYFIHVNCGFSAGKQIYARDIIETVTLPTTLLHLGNNSFDGSKLSSISLPEQLISIGNEAFYKSSLVEVKLPSSLRHIGEGAFSGCAIKSLTLPENLDTIGSRAFSGSRLVSITIPKKIKKIGSSAFANITTLSKINYNSIDAESEKSPFSGSSCDRISIGDEVKSLPDQIFADMSSNIREVTFPSSLRNIGNYAFDGHQSLVNVKLPEGLEYIGEYAFRGTSLSSLILPESLRHIGDYAFSGTSISELTIPSDLSFIGHCAFEKIKTLEKVEYNCKNATIGTYLWGLFGGTWNPYPGHPFDESICSEFIIDDNVEYIMPGLLYGANISTLHLDLSNVPGFSGSMGGKLDKVVFSPNMKHIPNRLLYGTEVADVILPPSLESIGDSAFYGCVRLYNLELPGTLKYIGNHAFHLAKYAIGERLSLPPMLEYIGDYAFASNTRIYTVFIPESVKYIGKGAFTFVEKEYSYNHINKNVNIISMTSSLPESNGSPFYHEEYNWIVNKTWNLTALAKCNDELDDNWSGFNSINQLYDLHCDPQVVFSPDFTQLFDKEYHQIISADGFYIVNADFKPLFPNSLVLYSSNEKGIADNLIGKTIKTHDLAAYYHGLYLLLPAGTGKVDIEIEPGMGSIELLQGNGQNMTVESSGNGISSMDYDLNEPTPLFIYRPENSKTDYSIINSIKVIPDEAAVETVDADKNNTIIERFLIDGQRVANPKPGSVVIERLSDGTIRKTIVK